MNKTDGFAEVFTRQLLVPSFGYRGHQRLRASRVLIVGIGGLGSPAALYLAASGCSLGLVDKDRIEASNIPRQVLFGLDDVGKDKAETAALALGKAYPYVQIDAISQAFSSANAAQMIAGYNLVINGVDDYATRLAINAACMKAGIPWIDGGALQMGGYVGAYAPQQGCYQCLFPELPSPEQTPTCQLSGILPPVVGIIGLMQALQAIQILCGTGTPLYNRLLSFDASYMRWTELRWKRNPHCWCAEYFPVAPKKVVAVDEDIQIAPDVAQDKLRGGAVLWDVRSLEEFAVEHVPQAESHPELLSGEIPAIAQDCPVIVICERGVRSLVGALALRQSGYQAWSLQGGIRTWKARGLPTLSTVKQASLSR